MSFLHKIRKETEQRIVGLQPILKNLCSEALNSRKPHTLETLLSKDLTFITELKYSSPSEGVLRNTIETDKIISEYLKSGASGISILTEPKYFGGSLEYLKNTRKSFPEIFLLMKDFIVNESQIYQARIYGADAILLIIAMLNINEIQHLLDISQKLGLTAFIEVNNEEELECALQFNPKVILVNNRNLHTLEVDMQTSSKVAPLIPKNIFSISASGIQSHEDIKQLQNLGYNGFLIGSHLMKQTSPGEALKIIINGSHHD